jgi:hypothetical protein
MRLKRLILLLFILVSLNFYYQPIQVNSLRYKHTIVRQINFDEDESTKELLSNNRKIMFSEFISINIQIKIINRIIENNDTS